MRIIATSFKLSTDLERIGDHAFDIAKIARDLSGEFAIDVYDTPRLGSCAVRMIEMAIEAYRTADIKLAEQVCRADDEMDELFARTFHQLSASMLRTTTEAFSAVIGGIDSLQVSPFDECLQIPDEFSRRIARNTQIILQSECNLCQPVDPAGGSWYIETLTQQVAEKSWQIMQEVEKKGGMDWAKMNKCANSLLTGPMNPGMRSNVKVQSRRHTI